MERKIGGYASNIVTYNPKVRIRNSDSTLSSSLALLDVQSVRRFLPPCLHPSLPNASISCQRAAVGSKPSVKSDGTPRVHSRLPALSVSAPNYCVYSSLPA